MYYACYLKLVLIDADYFASHKNYLGRIFEKQYIYIYKLKKFLYFAAWKRGF